MVNKGSQSFSYLPGFSVGKVQTVDQPRVSLILSEDERVQQWNDTTGQLPDEQSELVDECTKVEDKSYKTRDLIPGIFAACCPHQICYGFHMLVIPEERKDLMKVLYERIPEDVLKQATVLYDFACNAGEYIALREPKLFSMTQLLIDRFHSGNHKCSSLWKINTYPGFNDLVSTASEAIKKG